VRAGLEAIALQVTDVLEALPSPVAVLRADGGATSNAFLMQLQADLAGCPVEVSADPETTALGAAALAGLALGVWPDTASVAQHLRRGTRYEPGRRRDGIDELRAGWRLAVRRALLR
jgi:glycerol kinase